MPLDLNEAGKSRLWRGFNLLEKFKAGAAHEAFREEDFATIAEWGFNFVRLPLSYLTWSSATNWRRLDERVLQEVDQAVAWGRAAGIHVSLNLHRAPGYSVDRSATEPFNLWRDMEALEACAYHWRNFAARYRGVPGDDLSFDLINEPATRSPDDPGVVDAATYDRVLDALIAAIRAEDEDRPILIEGGLWSSLPLPWRRDRHVGQSLHVYVPISLTHWRSEFLGRPPEGPKPRWPMRGGDFQQQECEQRNRQVREFYRERLPSGVLEPASAVDWDRTRLSRRLAPWTELTAHGVPVHVGEFGVDRHTPHSVALAWMRDALSLFRENHWGWALWQLHGRFGVLDSNRRDVRYEAWCGHRLDRDMLELLRSA